MRSADDWFSEYGDSHRNATNKVLHWICVPAIVISVIGLLRAVPFPQFSAEQTPWLNWGTLVMLAGLGFYLSDLRRACDRHAPGARRNASGGVVACATALAALAAWIRVPAPRNRLLNFELGRRAERGKSHGDLQTGRVVRKIDRC